MGMAHAFCYDASRYKQIGKITHAATLRWEQFFLVQRWGLSINKEYYFACSFTSLIFTLVPCISTTLPILSDNAFKIQMRKRHLCQFVNFDYGLYSWLFHHSCCCKALWLSVVIVFDTGWADIVFWKALINPLLLGSKLGKTHCSYKESSKNRNKLPTGICPPLPRLHSFYKELLYKTLA